MNLEENLCSEFFCSIPPVESTKKQYYFNPNLFLVYHFRKFLSQKTSTNFEITCPTRFRYPPLDSSSKIMKVSSNIKSPW